MNREIKFRAWNDFKGMITNPMSMSTIVSRFIKEFRPAPYGWGGATESRKEEVKPDDYILMQYTGLKDKNGKEIYEGDIVKYKISAKERFTKGEVIFKDLAWVISGKYRDIKNNEEYMRCLDEDDELEVIGNIYENPELIK